MATGDTSRERQEALEAAEAAHLDAIRLGRSQLPLPRPTERADSGDESAEPAAPHDRPTGPLPRERPPAPRPARRGAPLPVAAAVATAWAGLVSFLPVALIISLLVVLESGTEALGTGIRVATAGWLLGHGVPVHTPDGPVGLVPLAVSALAAWRLVRAGVHVSRAIGARRRRTPGPALAAAVAVGVGYAALGALAATVASGPGWGVDLGRAVLTLAGFGTVAGGLGAFHYTGVLAAWGARIPATLRAGGRAGAVAAAVILAAGAALAGVALAAAGGEPADILAAFDTGVAGQAGLTLLCLAYAPNLAGWATAYLLGPGFAVGTDTVVRSSEVAVGPLPALPVFAGLPDAALPTVGAVLLLVPVIAGVAGGGLVAKTVPGGWHRLLAALVTAVTASGVVGAVAAVSGGPLLGGGRLSTFGPDPGLVAGATAVTVAVGALLGVAATAVLAARRRRP